MQSLFKVFLLSSLGFQVKNCFIFRDIWPFEIHGQKIAVDANSEEKVRRLKRVPENWLLSSYLVEEFMVTWTERLNQVINQGCGVAYFFYVVDVNK